MRQAGKNEGMKGTQENWNECKGERVKWKEGNQVRNEC